MNGNLNVGGISCKGFINAIINYLPNHVVQAFYAHIANVHSRPFTYSLKAFQYLNITGRIFRFVFQIF